MDIDRIGGGATLVRDNHPQEQRALNRNHYPTSLAFVGCV